MNETVNRCRRGVLAARCDTAAVTRSPPHVSSIVTAIPSDSARSRICRARVRPPTFEILRLNASIARASCARISDGHVVDALVEDERKRRCARARTGTPRASGRAARCRRGRRARAARAATTPVLGRVAAVGIGDDDVVGAAARRAPPRPGRRRSAGIVPDLELEAGDALGTERGGVVGHRLGRRPSGTATYSGNDSLRRPPRSVVTDTPVAFAATSQQATSMALLAYSWPVSTASMRSLQHRGSRPGRAPTTAGASSASAARAPAAWAGR